MAQALQIQPVLPQPYRGFVGTPVTNERTEHLTARPVRSCGPVVFRAGSNVHGDSSIGALEVFNAQAVLVHQCPDLRDRRCPLGLFITLGLCKKLMGLGQQGLEAVIAERRLRHKAGGLCGWAVAPSCRFVSLVRVAHASGACNFAFTARLPILSAAAICFFWAARG